MKKFLSIAAICAMTMVTMVSCGKTKEPTPAPAKTPKVNVTVDNATIAPESKAIVTLTASADLTEAVEFTITSSDAAVATVAQEKVTMESGKKSVTVEVTALKDGKTTITAATSSKAVEMGTASVEISVTSDVPSSVVQMVVEPAEWGGYLVSFPDGSFSFNFYPNTYSITDAIQIDNFDAGAFGTLDSDGYLVIAAQAEGTVLKASDAITPENDRPVLYSSAIGATALGTGEDVYIAIMAWDDADVQSESYRAWAKINIGTSGAFSSLNVIEVYACTSDAEFKVGQKE